MSHRNMLGGLAFATLLAGVAGCGDNKADVSASTRNDNGQRLRVIGRVINAQTGLPVGASVEICGATSGAAGSDGSFVIELAGNLADVRYSGDNGHNTGLVESGRTSAEVSTARSENGGQFAVRFSAPGHATALLPAALLNDETGSAGDGETDPGRDSTMVVNMGTISLNTGFSQTVLVTRDGKPLPGVSVLVGSTNMSTRPASIGLDFGGVPADMLSCSDDVQATTNSVGVATFSDLDPFREYHIFVPAQSIDGDGAPDFLSSNFKETFFVLSSGASLTVNVEGASFFTSTPRVAGDDSVNFLVGSFVTGAIADTVTSVLFNPDGFNPNATEEQGTNVTGGFDFSDDRVGSRGLPFNVDASQFHDQEFVTSADGSITYVFSSPVHVVQGGTGREVHFTYVDNMSDPRATATYNHRHTVTGTASEVPNSLGTLWRFRPSQTIPAYTSYSFQFTARSTVDPSQVVNFTSFELMDEGYFRVPTGLSGTINAAADNYNGALNSTATASVYLEFDRVVVGNYRVVEYTSNNTRFAFDGSTTVFPLTAGGLSIVNNVNAAPATLGAAKRTGATAGFRFRAPLVPPQQPMFIAGQVLCGDNTAGFKNQVRVAIVVQDIEGNRLDEIQDLDVK